MKLNSKKNIRLLVAGGGTGGHLYPALAIVEAMESRGMLKSVLFTGTRNGIEARKVPEKGYKIKLIWISGFRRSLNIQNLLFPIKLIVSLWQSFQIIRKFKPTVVLGTGGYVSGPVLYMAARKGIPTLIQEQNSFPGVTTRLLAARVVRVHLSFETSGKYFKNQERLRVTGNPVSKSFSMVSKPAAYDKFKLDPGKPTLLITGGSQGAHAINECILRILPRLMQLQTLQIIWSTGKLDFETARIACEPYRPRINIGAFIDDMPAAYSISDLAVGRAGAITLAEMAIAGVPAILVPYPYAAGQHQLYNAQVLAENDAAIVIQERELTPEKLYATIFSLINNQTRLKGMHENMSAAAKPHAAAEIAESLAEIAFQ